MPVYSKRGGSANGLLGSCSTADTSKQSSTVVQPKVPAFQTYHNAPSAKRFLQASAKQNELNNASNRQMKGGMAVLKLAGVTPTVHSAKTVVVPSFGTNSAGPLNASSNSKAIAQQGWNISEKSRYDSQVSRPKQLGNQKVCTARGGSMRKKKQTKKGRNKNVGRRTRKR